MSISIIFSSDYLIQQTTYNYSFKVNISPNAISIIWIFASKGEYTSFLTSKQLLQMHGPMTISILSLCTVYLIHFIKNMYTYAVQCSFNPNGKPDAFRFFIMEIYRNTVSMKQDKCQAHLSQMHRKQVFPLM